MKQENTLNGSNGFPARLHLYPESTTAECVGKKGGNVDLYPLKVFLSRTYIPSMGSMFSFHRKSFTKSPFSVENVSGSKLKLSQSVSVWAGSNIYFYFFFVIQLKITNLFKFAKSTFVVDFTNSSGEIPKSMFAV